MNKTFLFLFVFTLSMQGSYAQIDFNLYSTSYLGKGDKNDSLPSLMTAKREVNDYFWYPGSNLANNVPAKDPAFDKHRVKASYHIESYDSSYVHFFAPGLYPDNAHLYEFRVILNDKTIITPWSTVTRFTEKGNTVGGGTDPMGYLGAYKPIEDKNIIVDLRKKGSDSIFAYTVVFCRSVHPHFTDIYLSGELNEFLRRLRGGWQNRNPDTVLRRWARQYPADEIDPKTALPKKLVLPSKENNIIFYLNHNVYEKEAVEYELEKDGATYVPWKINDFDNGFIWLKDLTPGEYVIKFRYSIQRHHVASYPFRIKPAWHQTALFKFIAGSLIAAFFGFIILLFRLSRQKRKMREEASRKAKLQLELKAIRAQLNPHFIFNSLSSIQGLINKNDIAAANRYLSEFGSLMRHSLTGSDKDVTTVHDEITSLETYLKLEQLRFRFQFSIQVDPTLDAFATEIPSLLLQPLAENAVKHGVSGLQENGMIQIDFKKDHIDMVATIRDNGHGFAADATTKGYGLKLTKDRIALLNEVLKEQSITLTMNSTPAGTTVHLLFKNWLS
jgi:two-component system, LytTR family, sensor kinase